MAYLLIRNGTLIDGNGGQPLANGGVLIEDNCIRAVGPLDAIALPDADIAEVDARGGFVLPGFIDTHVHLMMEGMDIEKIMATPFSLNFYKVIEYMRRTVEAGVTSVRDAGGVDLGVKQAVEQGLVLGPRIQICVTSLSITGGHGDGWMPSGMELHLFPEYPGMPDGLCDGPEEVAKKVREVLRAGAEVIGQTSLARPRHRRRCQPYRSSRIHPVCAGGTGGDRAGGSLPPGREGDGPRRGSRGHQERRTGRHSLH